MGNTTKHNERIAKMTFASIYPNYVAKIEKKGRSIEELHQVIEWLKGYDKNDLQKLINDKATLEYFFKNEQLNKNASLITGSICGYKVQEITNPLTQQVRYLDKLVRQERSKSSLERCDFCLIRGN